MCQNMKLSFRQPGRERSACYLRDDREEGQAQQDNPMSAPRSIYIRHNETTNNGFMDAISFTEGWLIPLTLSFKTQFQNFTIAVF